MGIETSIERRTVRFRYLMKSSKLTNTAMKRRSQEVSKLEALGRELILDLLLAAVVCYKSTCAGATWSKKLDRTRLVFDVESYLKLSLMVMEQRRSRNEMVGESSHAD